LQPCTRLTRQLPQLDIIGQLQGRHRRNAARSRLTPTREWGSSGNNWSAARPPSLRCGDPTSQLPQGNRYIWERLVGCQAAIAGRPAPTRYGVHLR
jgi:hypothetical protein